MTRRKRLNPIEVSDLVIPRLLDGEALTRRGIEREYGVPRRTAQEAIRVAREVLFTEHGAILPIAHKGGGYAVAVTTDHRTMYAAERAEIRSTRTRIENLPDRLGRYTAHLGDHQVPMAGKVHELVTKQADALGSALDLAEAFAREVSA